MLFAGQDEGKREEVYIEGAILVGEDGLPNAQGFEHLKFLREQQRDPPKAVVKGVDFEQFQMLP